MKALKNLYMNGGSGQIGVSNVNGHILTLQESAAKTIAKDMIDDAERRHDKKIGELSLMQLCEGVHYRVQGRMCTAESVMAEIGREFNKALSQNAG